jgi:mRNA-degrading endonuclease RelE of RelBE toxin-antitoxin system
MRVYYSDKFVDSAKKLSGEVKEALKKKLDVMLDNPQHPSLRTKKIQGQKDVFESSITMGIRITWQYIDDGIYLRNIGEHDKTLKKP